MGLDYGCDLCGDRKSYNEIIWLTSSYGLCEECESTLTTEEKERLQNEYE